jgi:CheY-like chemotaxis protein
MKILTVDDDALIRKIIRKELEPSGYEIVEAKNGKEGLEKLCSVKNIALVTLDIEMPVMNGFEVLSCIQNQEYASKLELTNNTEVPVILVTANDTKKVRDKGFNLGASNFVVKPFSKGELLSAVNKILKPNDYFKDLSVLIVDDSKTTRKFIVSSIRELGITIYEADDGETAFNLLKKLNNQIDLIISDLNMKRMDGDELCRLVRSKLGYKNIPFIFLSANEDRNVILKLFKSGATDYISKPFFKEELLARMNVHLAHRKMHKLQIQTISELKAMKRLKTIVNSLFTKDLRPLLQSIIDSAKHVTHHDSESKNLDSIIKNISSSSQALLYKVNNIYDELDRTIGTKVILNKSKSKSNKLNILIAEAKKMDSLLLTKLLQDYYNCSIVNTENVVQTIEAVQNSIENASIDIMFVDIDSPEINAITTLKTIKLMFEEHQLINNMIIVAMTNSLTDSVKHTCEISGILDIMLKPIKRLQLKSIMNKYAVPEQTAF